MGSLRPEQEPAAHWLYTRWIDQHRQDVLGRALRKLTYQAARFDSTPSADELAGLSEHLSLVEEALTTFLAELVCMADDLADLQQNTLRLKADKDAGKSEWQVFGLEDNEDIIDRLGALWGLRPPGWTSQNRLAP